MPSASPACSRARSAAGVRLVSSATRSGPVRRAAVCSLGHASRPPSSVAMPGVVLLGQHLGRRHQRALVAALDRGEQGGHGDDGLARARRRPAAGGAWGGARPCRRGSRRWPAPGRRSGERAGRSRNRPTQLPVDRVADARSRPARRPACASPGSAGGAAARRRPAAGGPPGCRPSTRGVDLVHAPSPARPGPGGPRHGSGSGSTSVPARRRASATHADLPAGEAGLLRLGVDGNDPPGAVADQVDDRVGHLAPAPEALDLAEHHDLGALAAAAWPATAG